MTLIDKSLKTVMVTHACMNWDITKFLVCIVKGIFRIPKQSQFLLIFVRSHGPHA
jgi:hypothetical protein